MMLQNSTPFSVAIIGAGFTGTMLACQLVANAPSGTQIMLFDRRAAAGLGVAYSTNDSQHILNVRAKQMSAYPDQPNHFTDWLRSNEATWRALDAVYADVKWDENSFMPRRIFGAYVQSCLQTAMALARVKNIRLEQICADITSITNAAPGFTLNGIYQVQACVLATGNASPQTLRSDNQVQTIPSDNLLAQADSVANAKHILIVGMGLSMIDALVSLRQMNYTGQVSVLSSRAALPLPHEDVTMPVWNFSAEEVPLQPSQIVKSVRQAARQATQQGQSHMPILTHWRHASNHIWQSLSGQAKRSLRRVMPYWSPYRHRMPQQAVDLVQAMLDSGKLQLIADRVTAMQADDNGAVLVQGRKNHYRADMVVHAAGYNYRPDRTDSLTAPLLADGTIAMQDGALRVTERDGFRLSAQYPLYACGPLLTGVYLETVAVPELRVMAAKLARDIVRDAAIFAEQAPDLQPDQDRTGGQAAGKTAR